MVSTKTKLKKKIPQPPLHPHANQNNCAILITAFFPHKIFPVAKFWFSEKFLGFSGSIQVAMSTRAVFPFCPPCVDCCGSPPLPVPIPSPCGGLIVSFPAKSQILPTGHCQLTCPLPFVFNQNYIPPASPRFWFVPRPFLC